MGPDVATSYDWAKWRSFWSLRPIARPAVPEVRSKAWLRTPVDAFVLHHLEERGLAPAPEADKATLIRRATFDLLGLPPTTAELRAFLADASPDAFAHLVDRLLASPHYGEKWGRHWLDVARYTPGRITFPGVKHAAGDSAYRDYVVRAFNDDKPYDQFVIEQLAGDLLPPAADRQREYDQITAPAFLSIGPWFDLCTDPNRLRLEMVDDMINATSKTFLGLTVSCARCHDHKFDPIPTADYYAMAGVFGSTRIVGDFSDYWRDGRVRLLRPLAMPDEVAANDLLRKQIAAIKSRRWKLLTDAHDARLATWQRDEPAYRAAAAGISSPVLRAFEAEDFDGVYNLRIAELSADGKVVQVIETLNPILQWVRYKMNIAQAGAYRLEALYSADEPSPITVQVNGVNVTDSALADATGGWELKFREWKTVADIDLHAGLNFIRMTRNEGSFPRINKFRLVKIDPAVEAAIAHAAEAQKLDARVLRNFVLDGEAPWPWTAEIAAYLSPDELQAVAAFDAEADRVGAQIAPHAMVVAVTDQPSPGDMPIHPRGSVDSTAPAATPRGAPRLLDGALPQPRIAPGASGRLELARWIVDSRNPLTPRVMANRVWQWHFGQGIVATPSDFGSRGTAPTNPALLDWLASELVDGGWSLKKLHRQIMLSSTYRMSDRADAATVAADPDDSVQSRFAPRRLEAEELFDAMFSSTNVLVHQPSGEPLDLQKSLGRGMYVLTTNRAPPGLGADVRKMFALFDVDMNGGVVDRRPQSNTAAQALFWLNSPLPRFYAEKFADRLLKMDKLSDEKRLEQACLIAWSRAPEAPVREAMLHYLREQLDGGASPLEAWTKLCVAIYASDEFHYVN